MHSAHDRYLARLPGDWPRRELREICARIVSGGTPSRDDPAYWDGSIPWVTPGELTGLPTKYLVDTEERITDLGLASSGATLVPRDSLLVTTRATLGSVALAAKPLATNQGFKSAVFGSNIDATFFYHAFNQLKPELTRRASGTTFLEISGSQFSQIVVPVPPIAEQQRIGAILDVLDENISATERLIGKLEAIKEGLADDLLSSGIDDSGQLRNRARESQQFAATPLGKLPCSWAVMSCEAATSAPIGYGIVKRAHTYQAESAY
jgi:type I restriction enzyme, S subunit